MGSVIFKGEFLTEDPDTLISELTDSEKYCFKGDVFKYEIDICDDKEKRD